METNKKIEELRKKKDILALKVQKKQEELETAQTQYEKLEQQIDSLETANLRTALKAAQAAPQEAVDLLNEIKKLSISPLEAVELLQGLQQENSETSSSHDFGSQQVGGYGNENDEMAE
ncbi:hypothetical protein GHI93_00230 [Lactococcus hircilactis]|uniref:DUF4315 family protein n=1 Tax=Lactococcus hircilactis TaxID=1494462 RepID=A0A7X2D0H0_9LACT|nr:hypothetical protein [Lactococcus hircilactis]MQW38377.1 hypothetical protein [Lactococcus hircilactis]